MLQVGSGSNEKGTASGGAKNRRIRPDLDPHPCIKQRQKSKRQTFKEKHSAKKKGGTGIRRQYSQNNITRIRGYVKLWFSVCDVTYKDNIEGYKIAFNIL